MSQKQHIHNRLNNCRSLLRLKVFYTLPFYVRQSHLSCLNTGATLYIPTFNYIWWAAIKIKFPPVSAGLFIIALLQETWLQTHWKARTLFTSLHHFIFLPALPSTSFSSPHTSVMSTYLLYLSVHLPLSLSPQSFTLVYLSSGPQANMVHYIFNVVCNCLALSTCQEQIIFPESSFMFGVQGSQSVLCECCTADCKYLISVELGNS